MDIAKTSIAGGAGSASVHESAHKHVTGRAHYVDDMAVPADCLHACFGLSSHAHAEITSIDFKVLDNDKHIYKQLGNSVNVENVRNVLESTLKKYEVL